MEKSADDIKYFRKGYRIPAIHLILWAVVLSFPFVIGNSGHSELPLGFSLTSGLLHLGLFYFNAFFLYPRFMNRRQWWFYILCFILLIAGTFRLKYAILRLGYPDITYTYFMNAILGFPIVFFLVLSIVYRVVTDRVAYDRMLKEREAEQLTTELKFLRSQISPHFLFNVLNNMVSMARHQSDQLEPSLIRLAGIMRYMLYESDKKKVPVGKEIEYLKSYIELQRVRFGEDVDISFDLISEGSGTIEPMLLIPFVENAFKHGIGSVDKPYIHIGLQVKGKALHFQVENKYSSVTDQSKDPDSGIGLSNIKTRLQLLYPGRHTLSLSEGDGIFRTSLKLPLA